jgi:GNAT superfamily N-acetyltransferase
MAETTYRYTNYRAEYHTEVLRLLAELWGKDLVLSDAYFEWKYLNNPYVDYPRIYLAFNNGDLVGVRSYYATHWLVGGSGRSFLCLADADAVIHPEHRRKGILTNLTNLALQDMQDGPYEFIITLSANQNSAAAILKMGWKNVGFLQTAHYARVLKTPHTSKFRRIVRNIPLFRSIYRMFRPRVLHEQMESGIGRSSFEYFDHKAARNHHEVSSNIAFDNHPKPAAMIDLIERIGHGGYIQHVRDQEFFAWRYQNPRSEYRFLYWGNEQLDGYLVLRGRINHNDGKVMIVDWEATELEIARQLLQAAIQLGDFTALSIWSETLSLDRKQLLTEFGFRFAEFDEQKSADFPPLVLVRPVRLDMVRGKWKIHEHNMLEMSNWDLRAIYSDGV